MAPVLSSNCLVCGLPFTGALGLALKVSGMRRSPRNPHCCSRCNAHIEEGRLVELTMVFADLSSFTELTQRLGAEDTYRVVDKYLRAAGEILTARGGFIDKHIGDCVMCFFNVPVKREDHAAAAIEAARELQRRLPELSKELGQELRASVGVATGYARVGRLGSDDVKDYTAIGDVVNQAARLQAQARAGEIVVSENAYAKAADKYPGVARELLTLKGFREPSPAYRLKADGTAAAAAGAAAPALAGPALDWGGLLFALMGGGCLGKVFLGSFALSLGAGSGSALLAFSLWFDRSPLRVPSLIAAALAAAASLALVVREHRQRKALEAKNGCIRATPSERRRNLLVTGLSFAALLLVSLELCLHTAGGKVFRHAHGLLDGRERLNGLSGPTAAPTTPR